MASYIIGGIPDSKTAEMMDAILEVEPKAEICLYENQHDELELYSIISVIYIIHVLENCEFRAVQMILLGGDTFFYSYGISFNSPRWHLSAMSKKLKKVINSDDPLVLLAERSVIRFPGGAYQGIKYRPTRLGRLLGRYMYPGR